MKNILKEISRIVILGGVLVAFQAIAFTEPTQAPPGGNVPAPINVGSISQTKSGGFTAASLGSLGSAFLATDSGNVGIGTLSPTAKLDIQGNVKIVDGTQGSGRVLTSDANGLASWKPTHGLSGSCVVRSNDSDTLCTGPGKMASPIAPAKCNVAGDKCACEPGYLSIVTGSQSSSVKDNMGDGGPSSKTATWYTCLQN